MKYIILLLFPLITFATSFDKCIATFITSPASNISKTEIINYCKCLAPKIKERKTISELFNSKASDFQNRDYCSSRNIKDINSFFSSRFSHYFVPYIEIMVEDIYKVSHIRKLSNKDIGECMTSYFSLACSRHNSLLSAYNCLKKEFSDLNDYPYRKCINYNEKINYQKI